MIIRRKDLAAKAYLDLVAMIAALPARGRISEAEELVLLNILDRVVKQKDMELARVIGEFLAYESNPDNLEIEEIVKATLMSSQLNDINSRDMVINLIGDLAAEKKKLSEQGQ